MKKVPQRTLRELRQERGWSQAELARQANLHSSTVSLIERGQMQAYPTQVEKLAKALGMTTDEVEGALPNFYY